MEGDYLWGSETNIKEDNVGLEAVKLVGSGKIPLNKC